MKAIVYRRYGGVEVLKLEDSAQPTPVHGQVLMKVRAASVNPIDWKIASGRIRLFAPAHFPQVPGFDVAGEVTAIGPRVTAFAVGDRVHARLAGGVGGSCAEYTLAGLDVTSPIPADMDFATAAGLPLAGMTALQALRDSCGLPMQGATSRVLVAGASGGVGHLAVQIARAAGATVIEVCSSRNLALVASLGAHEVIDYKKPDPYRGQKPFDVIMDCVGGSPSAWLPRLNERGHFVSTVPGPSILWASALNLFRSSKVHAVKLKPSAEDLAFLDRLVDRRALRVVVDSRFPLADLKAAWERSMSGRVAGKVIVDM